MRDALLEEKIVAGLPLGPLYPELENSLLLCATELTPPDQIDRLGDKLDSL